MNEFENWKAKDDTEKKQKKFVLILLQLSFILPTLPNTFNFFNDMDFIIGFFCLTSYTIYLLVKLYKMIKKGY